MRTKRKNIVIHMIHRGLTATLRYPGKKIFVLLLIFITGISATVTLAGSPEPEAVRKAYKKAEKTGKQMERDHENMKGEHELMFTAWKQKSDPLLTEDEDLLKEYKSALSTFKDISEKLEGTVSDDPRKEILINDYEKIQGAMGKMISRHNTLRKGHEQLFHEMMGH